MITRSDMKTVLFFLLFGTASVFIITMDITLRESRQKKLAKEQYILDVAISRRKNVSAGSTEVCPNENRQYTILDACAQRQLTNFKTLNYSRALSNIYFNDDEKIIFCSSPAIVEQYFSIGSENASQAGTRQNSLVTMTSLAELSPDEVLARIEMYTKTILIRHPFHDVLSGIDKVCREGFPDESKDADTNEMLPDHTELMNCDTPPHRTLNLQQLKDVLKNVKTYFETCRPCEIRYDYILRVETLDVDIENVSKGANDSSTVGAMKNIPISDIPRVENSPLFRRLTQMHRNVTDLKKFDKDHSLFGYAIEKGNDRVKCEIKYASNKCC